MNKQIYAKKKMFKKMFFVPSKQLWKEVYGYNPEVEKIKKIKKTRKIDGIKF